MIRQAVQTLTGRGGDPDSDPNDIYELGNYQPSPQTSDSEDGTNNDQDDRNNLQAQVERLSQNYETLAQRLSDKDRYIGRLEQENQQYRGGMHNPQAGGQPEPEPDPVLDEETASLFAEKYKEEPAKALVAIAEHMDRRNRRHADTELKKRDLVQQAMSNLQARERNILRQVDLAVQNLGPTAQEVVKDFVDVVRRGNGSTEEFAATWLGREIGQDPALSTSPQGVYRLIELETLKRQGNTEAQTQTTDYQPQPGPRSMGVSRPQAPSRPVSQPSDGSADGIAVEDQIADAIVSAQKGDDAQVRHLFHG